MLNQLYHGSHDFCSAHSVRIGLPYTTHYAMLKRMKKSVNCRITFTLNHRGQWEF